jgi:outer membrane receptor protein involved in Fe transport
MSLADLLRSLAASGYDILYSSDLVSPDLQVPETLQATDPLSRAREALATHHLTLRSDGQKRYVVTRSAQPTAPAASVPTPVPAEEHLDEVAVFASRYVLEDQANNVQTSFGHDDLEQVPGAQGDVMRAVRTIPGLANNLSSRPYVRGAFLEDVLVRFDGIPMVDPFHFKNFQNLVSAFDPATVERMDVYTGGFPVKYGTRTAAVFDIAPREVESGYEHRIGANLLSYDLSTVGRFDSWPLEWLATARHSTQKIVLQPTAGDIGEPSYSDSLGRLRWQINSETALIAGWMLLDDEVSSSSDPSTVQAVAHDRDVYGWLAAEWAPSGSLHSRSSLAVGNSERTLVGSLDLPGAATGSLDESREIATVDLRTDWTYDQSGSLLWEWGAETTFETADLRFSRRESLDAALAASLERPADATLTDAESPRSTVVGLFASVRRRWRQVEAEIGVRADHQDYQHLGSHSQLGPRLNVRFDPTSRWHLYGSWGHFTQAQRVDEWRAEDNQTTPDPATRVLELTLGVAHDVSLATHWRLETYYNRWLSVHPYLDNELNRLSLVPELGLDRVLIAPLGGHSVGLEASVRHSFGPDWVASASYILSRSVDELSNQDVLRSWDQKHAFNADLTWKHGLTSATLVVGLHSGWPRTPVALVPAVGTAPAYLEIGERNSSRWDDYFSADIRVARTVPLRSGDLLLWADATNVTNRDNQCCTLYGQVDGSGSLLPPTQGSWYPRVLNVGVEWRLTPRR